MPHLAVLAKRTMRPFALRIGVVAACLLLASVIVSAQLTVRFVPFADNSQIDGRNIFPRLRAQISATLGTTPITITMDKVFIVENNLMVAPDKVTALPGNVALVEWITTNKHDGTPTMIFVADGGESGVIAGGKNVFDSTVVVIKDSTSTQLYGKIDFGRVEVGQSTTFGLKVAASRSVRDGFGRELPTKLDSIRTRTGNFRTEWIGAIIDKTPPPVYMVPAFDYRVNLVFTPLDNNPVADILSAYYEDGFREDILLLANAAPYPRQQILNIISPNGGERFAPCQKVVVSWKGMERGFSAFLELTTNDGATWNDIDSTMDSSYVWTVPDDITDKARIRVRQKLQSNFDRFADGPLAPTTTVAFSPDGARFAVGYTNRKIVEFSAITADKIAEYDAAAVGAGSGNVTAIAYLPGSGDLVASVTTSSGSAGSLQRFTSGTASPVATKPLPAGTVVATVGTNAAGSTVFVVPMLKAKVLTYASATLDSMSPITLNAPLTASRILNNVITVVQLDGSIVSYDGTTQQEVQRTITNFATDRFPVIRNLDVAANGLAALGGQAPVSSPFRAQNQFTFVLDRATSIPRQVIHRAGVPTQVACAFSQTARYLGLGFMGQEQFEIHDIEFGQQLSLLTGAGGHVGFLSDLDFSPNGNAIVSSSVDSTRNVLLKRFNTPEEDASDVVFSIERSTLADATISLSATVIGRSHDTTVTGRICNAGAVPVIISGGSFKSGVVLKLPSGLSTDTILSGECLDVHVLAVVTDTGLIEDTLLLDACGETIAIPFAMRGIDHTLEIASDLTDFGSICVGERIVKKFVMLRNAGTDSVRINHTQVIQPAQFKVLNPVLDTILPPGGVLEIEVEFAPNRTGFDTATFVIRYADQGTVRRLWRTTGRGAGADIRLSHTALPFLTNVPQRSLTIYNSSDNPVTITSGTITSGAPFTVLTPLPLTINAHDSVVLDVRYDGGAVGDTAALALTYVPCAASSDVQLSLYRGHASISMPIVSADPRENVSIAIHVSLAEDVPYKGIRTIEGAFGVDPQLFLATSITSPVGTASIVSQDIVSGVRIVRFSVAGEFADTNEIATLTGPAGLALADSSILTPDSTATWFGAGVTYDYTNGVLRIVNPNPGRKILDRLTLSIVSVQPNPASDDVEVSATASVPVQATLSVIDAQSNTALQTEPFAVGTNPTLRRLMVAALPPGVYTVILTTTDATVASTLIVVR